MSRPVLLGFIAIVGAACSMPPAHDMVELDPSPEQREVAAHYEHEAMRYQRKAADLLERAAVYEQLFGPESDWVISARVLARYYEEQARDRSREAARHRSQVAEPIR